MSLARAALRALRQRSSARPLTTLPSLLAPSPALPAHPHFPRSLALALARPYASASAPPRPHARARGRGLSGAVDAVGDAGAAKTPEREPEHEPETFPLPDGVDGSQVGLYEIIGSEGGGEKGDGSSAIFGVHGPREFWSGGGGNIEAAGGGAFAVIEAAGRQYKVVAGDVLYTNRIPGEVNEPHVFESVACVGTMLWTVFGRPLVPGAKVLATVESQTRSQKVMVTKFKKRKGYTRRMGHRQPITRFRIDSVEYETPAGETLRPYEVEYDPLKPPGPNNGRFI